MKNIVVCIAILATVGSAKSQRDTIKANKDLPVINYETSALKTGDTAPVHAWITNLAESELHHSDSVLKNYIILDTGIWITLVRTKSLCNFITANWEELAHANTVFKNMYRAAPAFKKAGIAELSSYAKAALQPGDDLNKTYWQNFMQAMDLLTALEKEMFIGYVLSNMNASSTLYTKELENFKGRPFVSDTSIYDFLRGYVYGELKTRFYTQLSAYINKAIKEKFTKTDTLRGSITPERAWWDVLHYGITVKPDYESKTISGSNVIQYKVISDNYPAFMQIDLQQPLELDSVLFNSTRKLSFTKDGNAWYIAVPKQKNSSVNSVAIYYHGKVHEAEFPPWYGGWIWAKDSLGNPWMSVACEGIGASVWIPCKDHLSDEPDSGTSITLIVPDTLAAIANGRLQSKQNSNNKTVTYTWAVENPINNYNITAYIGKYVNFNEKYDGVKGKLDLGYWVLTYNLERAKAHMIPDVHRMLKAFEFWLGPYPFYADGYKLVDAPYLGMEHQSAVAYGNQYMNGYIGYGDSLALQWDYIIVHESGHEWFGNNISAKDLSDMWVHEGFTAYTETLFTEYHYGKDAGNVYAINSRQGIQNAFPVIGYYGVNDEIAMRNQDIYAKGSNLLHTIRHSIDNDPLFRNILIGLNKTFYHQTVTSLQVENYFSQQAAFDYSKVFDQYLRAVQIPVFEFYFSDDKKTVFYRYTNCVNGFNLPLVLKDENEKIKIMPLESWKSIAVSTAQQLLFNASSIEKAYYIQALETTNKTR